MPVETVVNGGAATGAFPDTTSPVSATTSVTITARWFGITRTTPITVVPGAPAPADWCGSRGRAGTAACLRIEATSTNRNAILSVHSRSGSFMFTLTNRGGGRYSDQRGWVTNPQQIQVRSNFGGSASANLTR